MSKTVAEKKIIELTRSIELEPNARNYSLRSRVYKLLKMYRQALADIDKAIELEPNVSSFRQKRGDYYFEMGMYDLALANYIKAIKLDPLTIIRTGRKNLDEILRRVELNCLNFMTACDCRLRGDFYLIHKLYDCALIDYSKAIELDKKAPYSYKKRGDLYFKMEKYNEALADYCKAVELYPKIEIDNHLDCFEPTLTRHRIIGYTRKIKQEHYSRHYAERGDCYFALGNYKKAIKDYNATIKEWSSFFADADIYYRNAQAHYRLGHRRAAVENFKKALAIYPKFHVNDTHVVEACYECAIACWELKRYEEATENLERYVFFKPEDIEAYRILAKCYRASGDELRAQANFAKIGIRGRRLF